MNKMKNKLIICTLFFSLITVFNLSAADKIFQIDAGLSTGVPFYGDKSLKTLNSVSSKGGHRIISGTVACLNVKFSDNLFFLAGNDTTFDLCWNGESYSNHLETAFYPGLKVYPGLGGLNFSCAYSVGTRWDFLSTEEEMDKAFWGNGFRLGAEYNFSYDSKYMLPAIGLYYRFCPRGSYHYDNILSLYLVMPF